MLDEKTVKKGFEKLCFVPEDAQWNEERKHYGWYNLPNVSHPFNEQWEIFEAAVEWAQEQINEANNNKTSP